MFRVCFVQPLVILRPKPQIKATTIQLRWKRKKIWGGLQTGFVHGWLTTGWEAHRPQTSPFLSRGQSLSFRLVINMLNVEDLKVPFHSGGTQSLLFPGSIEDGLTPKLTSICLGFRKSTYLYHIRTFSPSKIWG